LIGEKASTTPEDVLFQLEKNEYELLNFGTCSKDSMGYPYTVYLAAKLVTTQDINFDIVYIQR